MTIQTLTANWHFMRLFRLGIGLFIGAQAIQMHDSISGAFAAFFLFQAITDTGCCGAQGCTAPDTTRDTAQTEDIEYEEVKIK